MDKILERRAREGPHKKIKMEARALSVPGEVIDLTKTCHDFYPISISGVVRVVAQEHLQSLEI
jgi:hypothetical protein